MNKEQILDEINKTKEIKNRSNKNMIKAMDDNLEKETMLKYLSDLCNYPDIKIESTYSKIGETNIPIIATLTLPSGKKYRAEIDVDIGYLKAVPDTYNRTVEILLSQIGKEFMLDTYKEREKKKDLPRVRNFLPVLNRIFNGFLGKPQEEECEQKDKDIKYLSKCLDNSYKMNMNSELWWEKERNKLTQKLKRKEQECQELKEELNMNKQFVNDSNIESSKNCKCLEYYKQALDKIEINILEFQSLTLGKPRTMRENDCIYKILDIINKAKEQ